LGFCVASDSADENGRKAAYVTNLTLAGRSRWLKTKSTMLSTAVFFVPKAAQVTFASEQAKNNPRQAGYLGFFGCQCKRPWSLA
jgi:hypothetical protein